MPLNPNKVHNPDKSQGPTWLRFSTFNVIFKNSSIRANSGKLNVQLQGTDSITSIQLYYDTMKYHVAMAKNEAALYVLSGTALQVLLSIKKKKKSKFQNRVHNMLSFVFKTRRSYIHIHMRICVEYFWQLTQETGNSSCP